MLLQTDDISKANEYDTVQHSFAMVLVLTSYLFFVKTKTSRSSNAAVIWLCLQLVRMPLSYISPELCTKYAKDQHLVLVHHPNILCK
jgi:hypothetical protein